MRKFSTLIPTFVICAATACEQSSPMAPSSVPPAVVELPTRPPTQAAVVADYRGLYSGQYRIVGCSGMRHCNEFRGGTRPLTLRLSQVQDSVTGVFEPEFGFSTLDVSGRVADDGSLTLTGSGRGLAPYFPTAEMPPFVVRLNGDALSGRFSYVVRSPDGVTVGHLNSPVQRIDGEIIAVEHRLDSASAW